MRLRALFFLTLLLACTSITSAQAGGDDQVIRTFFVTSDVAWNNHNAQQLTNSTNATQDADFINVYGGWTKGMDAFVSMMTRLQAGPFHDVHRHTTSTRSASSDRMSQS